jgi:DNA-binding GntR family transcriptional regulator
MPVSIPSNAPPTTAEYVLDSIRDGILNGQYVLGSRFDQKAIARDLGVSLVPVREALRILEGEGFVNITPRRGAFVTDISATELEELYLIRAELEEMATQRAVPKLGQEELAHLAVIISQMEEATRSKDFARLMVLNKEFHFTIYEAAELSLLSELMNGLWNRSSLYRRVFTYLPERAVQALEEHKDIYLACESGDCELAGRAIRHNIRQTVNALLEEFENEENLTIKPVIGNGQKLPGVSV